MPQTVQQALSSASFYTDDTIYALVKLPSNAITAAAGIIAESGEPFGTLIVDKDEVTLLMAAESLEEFINRLPQRQVSPIEYRLITIDVELEPDLVGFVAKISNALAAAGVSILPYAAYSRDHLIVPATQFEAARGVLEQLQAAR